MIAEIARFLRANPGAKGREIARQLGLEKGVVNSLLYKNPKTFAHDDEQHWSLTEPNKLTARLSRYPGRCWEDQTSLASRLDSSSVIHGAEAVVRQ